MRLQPPTRQHDRTDAAVFARRAETTPPSRVRRSAPDWSLCSTRRAGLLALFSTAVPAALPAQTDTLDEAVVRGRVWTRADAEERAVECTWIAADDLGLPWLADVQHLRAVIQRAERRRSDPDSQRARVTTTVELRGGDAAFELRGADRRGVLFVRGEQVGACAFVAAPDAPVSLALRPLATLRRTGAFVAHVRWIQDARRLDPELLVEASLGSFAADDALRLPPGRYRLVIEPSAQSGGDAIEYTVELAPGADVALADLPGRRRARTQTSDEKGGAETDRIAWPGGWTELATPHADEAAHAPGLTIGRRTEDLWAFARGDEPAPPLSQGSSQRRARAESGEAWVVRERTVSEPGVFVGLALLPSDRVELRSIEWTPEDLQGPTAVHAAVPADRQDAWWVFVPDDQRSAILAGPLLAAEPREPIAALPSHTLALRVLDSEGLPVPDAHALVGDGPMRRALPTDETGVVEIGRLAASDVLVRIVANHRPSATARLEATIDRAGAPHEIALPVGLPIFGRALSEGEGGSLAAAAGAVVELRDPTRVLEPGARVTTTDAEGRFRFDGLADGFYVLFASHQSGTRTWSVRRTGIRPDRQAAVEIVLVDEDPRPPSRDRR
jgi:hypothetical protein